MSEAFQLEVQGLSVEFPGHEGALRAVRDVDFSLSSGEFVGLVGESGSGKSVTALTCLGLTPAPGRIASGSIKIQGQELQQMSAEELRRVRGGQIGFVFQEPMTALNPVLTVGFQIREAIRAHKSVTKKEAQGIAIDLLREVALPNPEQRVRSYPHELSGGQRQRVIVAMALAAEPRLLLADEPTTALDVTIQAQILELFQRLREERGLGILLITHDLGVVAETCQRVVVMYAGEVVEKAPVEELFRHPRHPYTQALMAALPRLDHRQQRMAAIEGMIPNPAALPPGCAFEPRCPHAFALCAESTPPIYSIAADRSSRCYLEDPELSPSSAASATGAAITLEANTNPESPQP